MTLKFSVLIVGFIVCACNVSAQSDGVYMKSGEYYEGEIISIGTEIVLIKVEDRVFSVSRKDVKYVFNTHPEQYDYKLDEVPSGRNFSAYDTLNRAYIIELAGGLYTFSNFAVSLQMIQWVRISDSWSAGLISSMDFSKYFMTKFGLLGKYSFPYQHLTRSYVTTGVAVGPWSALLIETFGSTISYDFSPILQGNIGAGIWYDTGYHLAFTLEGGMAITGFRLTEEVIDVFDGNINRQVSRAINLGPYFRAGLAF